MNALPQKLQRLLEAGLAAQRGGRLTEARASYRKLLEAEPRQADVLYLLGAVELQARNYEAARSLLSDAVALNPRQPAYFSNLGEAQRRLGRVDDAIFAFRRALELKPDLAEVHYNLGLAYDNCARFDDAIEAYSRALEHKPQLLEARRRLAGALWSTSDTDRAVDCLRRGIELHPNDGSLHNGLGVALKDRADLDGAVLHFKRAIELEPHLYGAHSNLVYALSFHPSYGAAEILEAARDWERQQLPNSAASAPDPAPLTNRRLRIGYVSPDFREHCQAHFTLPVLRHHDRSRFEIFCYSNVKQADAITRQIESLVDHFRDIRPLSDDKAAELIRADQLDVLVDLTMHMAENRLRVFGLKPAPVQVCWLAYPGTTGLSAIDYRLTDPYLDPLDSSEPYSEQSIRLPETFWCYEARAEGVEVSELPALKNGYVTFGCLNNFCKVNADVLELWAAVLKSHADSRLLLLVPSESARERTLQTFLAQGIASDRIEFVSHQPRRQYLETYQRIDVCLDTVPYNGHTTSLDAFWMGVPVVTLVGPTVVGRAGLCQAQNLKLPELIAETPQGYVQRVSQLCEDLTKLAELRGTLRARIEASPLMDGPRFTRHLESVFTQLAEQRA